MLTVHLHNLRFHGYHGLYSGEASTGNQFEMNLDVTYSVENDKLNSLKNLISYEELYNLVQQRMAIPTPLLEELAASIMRKIRHQFAHVKSIHITIFKLQAPIENFQGKVGISFFRKFED